MPPKKSIFRQPSAKHFQLVHRSQRDPLIHDSEASPYVLKPFERENEKKETSRSDLEQLLLPSDLESDNNRSVGGAALYGIYYDDTKYDYLQHLRPIGVQEDGVESVLIEAPLSKKKNKAKEDDLCLPPDIFPSTSELPRDYQSLQAIPESIAGLQPDMDPHLRQVLEALEDDAFVDDGLDDEFFARLVAEGERMNDDNPQFECDEIENDRNNDEVKVAGDEESVGRLNWEERYALFKQSQHYQDEETSSKYEFASEDGDTIGGLPMVSDIGKRRRKRHEYKGASDYSMSSSSMYRNEALQTLDKRFEQIMLKEYQERDNESSDHDDAFSSDGAPELITSREDFDSMLDEFLHDYEILGRKMQVKLEGNTGIQKLDTIRRALGPNYRVQANENSDSEIEVLDDTDLKEERWDCQTILTTYSNIENHPRIIRASSWKLSPKITVDTNTGFPRVNRPPNPTRDAPSLNTGEGGDDAETENTARKRTIISRCRNESKVDKKARKSAAKLDMRARRADKRVTKERFDRELKTQKQILLANGAQRVQKL